jgi:3-hydroxyisobutyrate dehydrogenase-like beta-hydroxyacid dehydrogenase
MDAPVGRTSVNAIDGTLLILAGGTDEQNLRVGASIPHFAADILTPVRRNQRSSLISMANGLSLIIQVLISVLMPNG